MIVDSFLYGLGFVLLLVAIFALRKLRFAYTHFRVRRAISVPSLLEELPSVSVCIPARNETHAMTQCLERVIESRYPKLEIIVLDDGSRDNTSVLIKSFAHAGVRFVEGSPLEQGWLGKNYALHTLLKEASGSYVFYMDVDTLISPDTIGQLVAYMAEQNASMVSVLPRRADSMRASRLFGTLRYFWEILLHTTKTPASAGNAWMIERKVLENLGGFDNYRTSGNPEAPIAAVLAQNGRYRMAIGSSLLAVNYEKRWASQIDTSIRLLYPALRKDALRSVVAALLLLAAACTPLLALLLDGVFTWIFLGIYIIFSIIFALFYKKIWVYHWYLGVILWPYVVVQEAVLIIASLVRHSTGTVTWKGRPIQVTD